MERARPATDDDVPRVAELARVARAELAPTRGGDVWTRREARAEPLEEGFRAALADPDQHVVVALVDEVVLGYGVVRAERLRDDGLLGVVDDLYVEPDARGVGLGEALMASLVAWCEQRGCFGVDAVALPGNRATKNFFEAFGLVARAIVVHRRLGEG